MLDTLISYYPNCKKPEHYSQITIKDSIDKIKSDLLKQHTDHLRVDPDPDKRAKYKAKYLPAVTFQGIFSYRSNDKLEKPAGLAVLDIDLPIGTDTKLIKEQLSKDPYVLLCFDSPSGGLKVVVKIPIVTKNEAYAEIYIQLLEHYKQYAPKADKSTKDISRLCFLSYDPNIYVNENAKCFEVLNKTIEIQTAEQQQQQPQQNQDAIEILKKYKLDLEHPYLKYIISDGNKIKESTGGNSVILKNNIFGVDLDTKAVEIAQLNLLLKAAEKKHRLPTLRDNIKVGNSLVDSKIIDNSAFIWNEEFKDIIQNSGFDIIIGNPPYVFTRDVEFQDAFKTYVQENYFKASDSISKSHARQSGKVNLYAIFLIKSIKLLKDNGLFGFIIPNNILRTTTYDVIRKFILDNCKIKQIVDMGAGVFEGVTASTIILILEKEADKNKRDKNKVIIYPDINDLSKKKDIEQKEFLDNTSYAFNITTDSKGRDLFEKIEKNTTPMGELIIIHAGGIATGENKKEMILDFKKNEKYKPMLEGKDIKPYYPIFANRYILYERKLLYRPREEYIFLSPEKIVTQRIGGGNKVIIASYDDKQFYTFNSTNTILPKNTNFSLKYILAILNSKLINWYYVSKFTNKSILTVNISKTFLEQLPIKDIPLKEQQSLIKKVEDVIEYLEKLVKLRDKQTDEKFKLEKDIEKIENEIDQEVYKLYNITEEEKKIIEESLK